jgi:NAD-dependent protein deacetylase/lipoamidase
MIQRCNDRVGNDTSQSPHVECDRLAELVRGARSVVALTGAGISVSSGIPDFRTPRTGLWEKVDPMEVAHIYAFHSDPVRFWRFYGERFATLGGKLPNGSSRYAPAWSARPTACPAARSAAAR